MIDDQYKSPPPITIPKGTEKTFSVPIECKPNYKIFAFKDSADCSVYAKAELADVWTNIANTPLPIGAFSPLVKTIYFKIAVANDAIEQDVIVKIRLAVN